jgi:glucan phosphoethanolaminetransferase (alkaline phosphatase superfamily)
MNMLKIIQTIYLMMALVLTIVCLCLPLVTFHEPELDGYAVMNNLWATTPEGVRELSVWPMFAVLLLTCLIDVFAIFHYKKRMFPARLCTINVLLILLWMALCAFYVYTYQTKDVVCHLEMTITHCLPAISLFFYIMALRSVIKAEQKVKAANKNGEVDTITATEV